ncbi:MULTISPECIES: hypothetical protein [Thermoanaerobacterium]|uniref:Uncharacterized protein n=2 Tax=Thermoanaerobacterium TaxID=28895 RepID=W9EA59_9THEO|nr:MULTISPECIES: hypothetical protein [Thermoanaerobacterium]AFK87449.1 hypothetical protein Tsac_2451 [Thermoanaerobacterium saccharolyticum JW/SL-YS485]ETO37820.1 hypothetical protein V518_2074 [Thermoanaerobacterium aotearoense SCUT27]
MEEIKQRKELLDIHLKEVSKWMEDSNIDPTSEFGQEFLKQTKELIEQFYEIKELKGRVTALEKQIQEFPEQLMRLNNKCFD